MASQLVSRGVVRGKTIELEHALGFPEGQVVTVVVQTATADEAILPPGEGIRRSAGAWADAGEELDAWLEEVQRSRSQDRPETL